MFWVECKSMKSASPKGALAQAINDNKTPETKMPIAVCKDNRKEPTVTMLFSDFIELMKEYMERS